MNKHIYNIISGKDDKLTLLENILIYINKNKDEIDIFDIAEIIKKDKTFYNILFHECKNNKLLRFKPNIFLKLTDMFKGE